MHADSSKHAVDLIWNKTMSNIGDPVLHVG